MDQTLASDSTVRALIAAAGAAPSIHNTQPWRFRISGDVIEVHGDPSRMLWVADPRGRALHLSCGAALFNLRLAIRVRGAKPLVWPLPDPRSEPTLLAAVQLRPDRPATPGEREMYEAIGQRHSTRAPFSERRILSPVQSALENEASLECAVLRMLSADGANLVMELAAAADRALASDVEHRVEFSQWIGTTGEDGIPVSSLGYRPNAEPAPVRDFGPAAPMEELPAGSYEILPQLAVLSTAADEPADWLRAGQALQRVLLAATVSGLATSLLYQPVELADMDGRGEGWWPWPECPQIIIRLGYGPPGQATPRRSVGDILDREVW
jgi:hypothetical protein